MNISEAREGAKVILLTSTCSVQAGTIGTIARNRTGENNGACTWRGFVWVDLNLHEISDGWIPSEKLALAHPAATDVSTS